MFFVSMYLSFILPCSIPFQTDLCLLDAQTYSHKDSINCWCNKALTVTLTTKMIEH